VPESPQSPPRRDALIGSACATCRGSCCKHGGDHAYLYPDHFRRLLSRPSREEPGGAAGRLPVPSAGRGLPRLLHLSHGVGMRAAARAAVEPLQHVPLRRAGGAPGGPGEGAGARAGAPALSEGPRRRSLSGRPWSTARAAPCFHNIRRGRRSSLRRRAPGTMDFCCFAMTPLPKPSSVRRRPGS
jgi:hypothetical protein